MTGRADFHLSTWSLVITGAVSGAITAIGALGMIVAEQGSSIAPFVSGGGAVTSSAVLALVAVKLSRGELVARDPAKAEQVLVRLVDERKDDHRELHELATDLKELTREAIAVIARNGGGNP